MPITPFLNGRRIDTEDRRILGVAFEMVCIALRISESDDDVKQAVATKIIDLARRGNAIPMSCANSLEGHPHAAGVSRRT